MIIVFASLIVNVVSSFSSDLGGKWNIRSGEHIKIKTQLASSFRS